MTAIGSRSTDSGLQQHRPISIGTYSILSRMFTLYRQVKKQERSLTRDLPGLLDSVVPDYSLTFSPAHFKRTTKYWQLGLNVICENLYKLTGHKLNSDEQKRIMLVSVSGPCFDDLFDDKLMEYEQILSLIANPEEYAATNQTDLFVKKIYIELLKLTPHRQLFIQHLKELCHWQKASLKQLDNSISEEELYQITYNKSYYAILLYCDVLDHYPNQQIINLLYPIAGLLQLTNDAFDVWKDVHNDVYTLPNLYRNFEQLQQRFLAETAHINYTLARLPYPAKDRQAFAIGIHSLPAMGWMALEQLQKVTAEIKSLEELKTLSRKQLICDLDTIPQRMKWLRHLRRFVNYYTKGSFYPAM